VNQGLAAERLIGRGDVRMVVRSEAEHGSDLDGDGDTLDRVLDLLDLSSGAVLHTGLALPRRFQRDEVPPPRFDSSDSLAVFQVSEAETGRDADGDGRRDEVETWVYLRSSGELRTLAFAHGALFLEGEVAAFLAPLPGGEFGVAVFDARDGSLTRLAPESAFPVAVRDRVVAFVASERGALDLNADGDTSDVAVLHLYDADARLVRNAGFEVADFVVRLAGGFAGFAAAEAANGGLDLDGDGDASDVTFVAVEARTGRTRIPSLSRGGLVHSEDPELFALWVPEGPRDENGDGDAQDRLLRVYDPARDVVVDTALAFPPFGAVVRSGSALGHPVDERDQGRTDLDGDGLLGDALHVHDLARGRSRNLGVSGAFLAALERHLLAVHPVFEGGLLVRSEFLAWDLRAERLRRTADDVRAVFGAAGDSALLLALEQEDRNGDGDAEDLVLQVFEGRTGALRNLGLAWAGADAPALDETGRGAFLVDEASQGADLNGDGDRLDQVLHRLELAGP
jgi:hypothetical protein